MRYILFYMLVAMFLGGLFCYKSEKKTAIFVIKFLCVIWALILGCRAIGVGNDTYWYWNFFENRRIASYSYYEGGTIDDPGPTMEWGFVLIARIIHLFTSSATCFFIIVELWIYSLIVYLYRKYSDYRLLLWNLVVLLAISNIFVTLAIAVRQTISICVFITAMLIMSSAKVDQFSLSLLKRKKVLLSILLFVLSIACHRTTILITPIIIFIYFFKLSKNVAIVSIFFALFLSLFIKEEIGFLMDYALAAISNMDSENVALLGERYAGEYGSRSNKIITNFLWAVPTILTVYKNKNKDVNNFFLKCLVLSVILNLILSSSSMVERISAIIMIFGFLKFVPDIVLTSIRWRMYYMLIVLFFLGKIFIRFSNWPDIDSTIPFYFFWQ